ncbi:MAG: hypothetical protein JXB13_15250 [Phycisphaerae bacterium]|nr:hypothetical protein [Phycisphaerae bacterium]
MKLQASVGLVLIGLSLGPRAPAAPGPATQKSTPEVVEVRREEQWVFPVEELRRRGCDVPDLPRDQNAFWTMLEAVNAYREPPDELRQVFDYAADIAWPAEHDAALRAYVLDPANQTAVAAARRAATMDRCQMVFLTGPNDSLISVLVPDLKHFRAVCKLLIVDGRRLETDGQYGAAMEDYAAVLGFARHLGTGPSFLHGLFAQAVWGQGIRTICTMVLRRDLPADDLRRVHQALAGLTGQLPTLKRGLESERAMYLSIADDLVVRPTRLPDVIGRLGRPWESPDEMSSRFGVPDSGWARLETCLGRLLLPDRTAKRQIHRYFDPLVEAAGEPYHSPAWQRASSGCEEEPFPTWNVVGIMLSGSPWRGLALGKRVHAETRLTQIVVALRLHALEHSGQWPESLVALMPSISKEDIIDPFSGREFVYRRDGTGWTLYSISENETDDGGKSPSFGSWKVDFVLQLPMPAPRPFEPRPKFNMMEDARRFIEESRQ